MVNPSSFPDSPVGRQLKIRVKPSGAGPLLCLGRRADSTPIRYETQGRENAKSDELISLASSLKKSFFDSKASDQPKPKGLNNLRQPECSKPAENGKPGKVRLRCDAYRRTDLSSDLFQTVGVAQSADFNTTANHIERGIHRLADNHTHRVFGTHHCTSCLSPRTKGTLTFILTCLSCVYAKSTRATKINPLSHRGSPGEIRTPVSR